MNARPLPFRRFAALAAALLLTTGLAACSSSSEADEPSGDSTPEAVSTLRLGFFPNVTHAPALVGLEEGLFKKELKEVGVTLTPTAFNAGPDAVTALLGGSLDISYIGPNPTINAYITSGGDAIRVISGTASAGAALVVRPEINSAQDLKGKAFATPQLGNTQDVAFRYWLDEQGLSSDTEGGGDVSIKPQSNSEGLTAYGAGDIDGAWVPEPWVSEYLKKGAKVLVDEATLWPDGQFVTTNIIVRTKFLEDHPDVVTAFLKAHVAALQEIKDDPAAAKEAVNTELNALTGSTLEQDVLDQAFTNVIFTADPLPATLTTSAEHAISVGLLEQDAVDSVGGFGGLYALDLLNQVLSGAGLQEVSTS